MCFFRGVLSHDFVIFIDFMEEGSVGGTYSGGSTPGSAGSSWVLYEAAGVSLAAATQGIHNVRSWSYLTTHYVRSRF